MFLLLVGLQLQRKCLFLALGGQNKLIIADEALNSSEIQLSMLLDTSIYTCSGLTAFGWAICKILLQGLQLLQPEAGLVVPLILPQDTSPSGGNACRRLLRGSYAWAKDTTFYACGRLICLNLRTILVFYLLVLGP